MIKLPEQTAAPSTYQDWLDCFAQIKDGPLSGSEDVQALSLGSFAGTSAMRAALERQITDTVNAVLDRSVKHFARDLNECMLLGEFAQADGLFRRLKREVHRAAFFLELSFLPEAFRAELYRSMRRQITAYWDDTVRFLQDQAMERAESDLEDALFLIRRIQLFSE